MTVLFTAVSADWIVACADSAVTLDFSDRREYETGRKFWRLPGLGTLSTWGARDGNLIGQAISKEWSDTSGRTIEEFAQWTHAYLLNSFQPKERGLGDAGYHLAGFMPDGHPRLFHSYYEVPRDGRAPFYDFQDVPIGADARQFLYNGRNDLAHHLVNLFLNEIRAGRETRFSIASAADACFLAHFVMRFVAEITPEVGPPFVFNVTLPTRSEVQLRFDSLDRIPLEELRRRLAPTGAG